MIEIKIDSARAEAVLQNIRAKIARPKERGPKMATFDRMGLK
jgi:hypothetical protein